VTVTAAQANVREGPGTTARVLTTLAQGATFPLLDRQPGWYKILLDDGRAGWIASAVVQVTEGQRALERLPSTPASPAAALYAKSWAVIVGIDRFQHPQIARLNYAVNDAQAVARALEPLGFPAAQVTVLTNERATRREIERVLSSVIVRATGPQDRLVLFFATHGVTAPLPDGQEEGYLLPYDADPQDLPFTALSMRALRQMGQRIPAKHILVAVDACYGGYSLVRAQAPPVVDARYLELLTRSRGLQVLTAGKKDQPVIEDLGHGVFTRKLLDGLTGHADTNGDGLITGSELGAWMHPRVAQASDYKQDMQFGNLDGEGQVVFVLPQAGGQKPAEVQVAVGVNPPRQEPSPAWPPTLRNGIGMEFVLLPAGTFQMGSTAAEIERFARWYDKRERIEDEMPQHRVTISREFYLGKYEVTQAQWRAVMGSNPSQFQQCGESCPVENISWEEVQEFIRRLNDKEGHTKYRLPTEAEWEYAARAGTETPIYAGELRILEKANAPDLDAIAWYAGNSGVTYTGGFDCAGWPEKQYRSDRCGPHPVGRKQPNRWGVYDMLGNVWEWVQDWYGPYPSGAVTDPQGPASGSARVSRGGSWYFTARHCRSAYRSGGDPGYRYGNLGFRLLRTAP
jgi:formylglycine-generating enzyme required for sulfatase activity